MESGLAAGMAWTTAVRVARVARRRATAIMLRVSTRACSCPNAAKYQKLLSLSCHRTFERSRDTSRVYVYIHTWACQRETVRGVIPARASQECGQGTAHRRPITIPRIVAIAFYSAGSGQAVEQWHDGTWGKLALHPAFIQ